MIDQRTIFDIHRLAHDGFSMRRIAALLGIDRQSVKKYRNCSDYPTRGCRTYWGSKEGAGSSHTAA